MNDIKVIQHTVGRIREYQLHFLSCLQFAAAMENPSAAYNEKIQNKCQLDKQKTSEWIFNHFHNRSLGMFTQMAVNMTEDCTVMTAAGRCEGC